jgi:proteasome lid subunit RPN8/RPN11
MAKITSVSMSREMIETLLEGARRLYPREEILLLRGKKQKDCLTISDFIIPPIASRGHGFSGFSSQMLPMDFSIVGIAHSHPSGSASPSPADLNHFFGTILLIAAFPFKDEKDIATYNRKGEKLALQVESI